VGRKNKVGREVNARGIWKEWAAYTGGGKIRRGRRKRESGGGGVEARVRRTRPVERERGGSCGATSLDVAEVGESGESGRGSPLVRTRLGGK
jgi:hypothetical protein